jgi:transcriptional regulator of met regulon
MSASDVMMPPGRYKVVIGSLTDETLSGISIKDFKVWNSFRSDHQIKHFRHHQLDPSGMDEYEKLSIQIYLKLALDNNQFENMAHITNSEYITEQVGVHHFGYS